MCGAATGFWGLLLDRDGEDVTSWTRHHSLHPDNTTSLRGVNPVHKYLSLALVDVVKKKMKKNETKSDRLPILKRKQKANRKCHQNTHCSISLENKLKTGSSGTTEPHSHEAKWQLLWSLCHLVGPMGTRVFYPGEEHGVGGPTVQGSD